MTHPRQEIRRAVVRALTGRTAASARVFRSRQTAWRKIDLPAVCVYTLEESVDPKSRQSSARTLERVLQLAVEGVVEPGDDVDERLDALAWEIERAMHADETFGGLVVDSLLSNTEPGIVADGDRVMGAIRLVYTVWFDTEAPLPEDMALDDFRRADIRYDLDGEQAPADQRSDTITLP